uniref:NAC domain-containing protein n=1 Tax=Oryza meridionalis TaxID=40149 RepID=A0A0E0EXI6_9ORYZ
MALKNSGLIDFCLNAAAAASSTDEPSTSSALPPPTPPRPLPDMAGPSSATPLLPLQLPDMARHSSATPLLPLSLPGLAGGMMSMADQANMTSTSQASTLSSELLQDWYDEFEITYGAVMPPSPSTISEAAPQSSPTGWWPSSNGGPMQHDDYLGMADPASYTCPPRAAIPPEPMAPLKSSPAPPPAVEHHRLSPPHDAAGNNYNYGGGTQAQHEHQHRLHPQEPQALVVDGEDGYDAMPGDDDEQLGGAEFDTERIAEMVNHIMDGEFEDNTVLKYNEVFPDDDEVVAAPMMIDGGGDGDGADGGPSGPRVWPLKRRNERKKEKGKGKLYPHALVPFAGGERRLFTRRRASTTAFAMEPGAASRAYLPDDLVADILTRLPARSVCRFRAPSWRALATERQSVLAHRPRRPRPRRRGPHESPPPQERPSADGDGSDGSNNNNGKWKGKKKVVSEYGKNRHGMPVGFYFVPKDLELFAILMCKLVRGEVPGALNNVFEQIRILEFHPALLRGRPASPPPIAAATTEDLKPCSSSSSSPAMACAETYIENMENGCMYFFSRRQFATKATNKRRPMRVANGGTWKASGGSKTVRSKKVGGIDVGQKLTMVFYERRFEGDQNPVKTNWAMHEYTKIIPGSKNQLEDLAVYRLYKIRRKEDTEPVNAAAAASSTDKPSTPAALPPPTPPPRPLPDMAGSSSATSLLPLQLPGLAGSSSTRPLALPLQLPGLPGSSSAMSLPSLAGEMTSMADQANMASTSQASTPSSELPQDWYDEYEVAYGAAAPPSPSTISWAALPSSPTAWWPSSNGGPVQHDGYLGMADPASYTLEHLLPTAAIPPEPMAPPKNSPAAPPPAVDHHQQLLPPQDAGGNYDHPELADYGGGAQAQHEHHHHPQELTDGADGDEQLELGAAEFDSERVAEMVSRIMDGEFVFKFEDDTIVSFNEVAAAPMLIEGGGDGDGDGADGGVGDDPFDN